MGEFKEQVEAVEAVKSIESAPLSEVNEPNLAQEKDEDILTKYEALLDKAFLKNSSELIPNSGEYHASLMMSKLFKATKDSIAMVVGSFSGEVSGKSVYLDALDKVLNNEKLELRLLILNEPNSKSEAFNKILDFSKKSNNRIQIKKATDDTLRLLEGSFNDSKEIHFSVFDKNKFRLEMSPKKFSAFGSFNDNHRATKLLNIFNSVFPTAKEFSL